MVAIRVVDDHFDLLNSGEYTHVQIDTYLSSGSLIVVSGSSAPPGARILQAGPGISIVDNGPGSTLVITANVSASAQVNFSWNEVPTGAIDGNNRVFSFANTPSPLNAFMLFLNGVKQREGVDSDFILSSSIVTFVSSNTPRSGSNIDATYQY